MAERVIAGAMIATALLGAPAPAQAGGNPPPCDTGENEYGSSGDGERVWYFKPDGEGPFPVVVYLHGFAFLAPDIYQGHIDHLVDQGYFVIFPQYNLGGLGIALDLNQYRMLDRAMDAVDTALFACEDSVDASDVSLIGHSLGGNMAAAWTARGGHPAQRFALLNPSTDAGFIGFITNELDHQGLAPQTTGRVMILTGESDSIASPSQSYALYDLMTQAASRVVYQAVNAGQWAADHMAPTQDDGVAPGWLMNILGGQGDLDPLDTEYYWPAVDSLLAGASTFGFPVSNGFDVSVPRSCSGICP